MFSDSLFLRFSGPPCSILPFRTASQSFGRQNESKQIRVREHVMGVASVVFQEHVR